VLYRHLCNRRDRVEAFLSDNSFGVYFIHTPVLIAITLLMAPYAWPPTAKFAIGAVTAIFASYGVVSLVLRRSPFVRRIL
jgi:surface polysaccharide O-acyltransferase-like enzyme